MTTLLLFALAASDAAPIRPMTPKEEAGFALCEAAFEASRQMYGIDAAEVKITYDHDETLTCRRTKNVLHNRATRPVQDEASP